MKRDQKHELKQKVLSLISNVELRALASGIMKSTEFKRLNGIIENNIVHKYENVLQHSLVFTLQLREGLKFRFVRDSDIQEKLTNYFSERVGRFKRRDLFLFSGLFHDLGKGMLGIVKRDKMGLTTARCHESKGARLMWMLVKQKSELLPGEIRYIEKIVRFHSGFSISFLNSLLKDDMRLLVLRALASDEYALIEIFLCMLADNGHVQEFKQTKSYIEKTLISTLIRNRHHSLSKVINEIIFQNKIHHKLWTRESRLFHLGEEVGELFGVYLQFIGAKDRKQGINDISIALDDVLLETFMLYDAFGLDPSRRMNKILHGILKIAK